MRVILLKIDLLTVSSLKLWELVFKTQCLYARFTFLEAQKG